MTEIPALARVHVLIAETKRCIDDGRLPRAVDKLNYLDGIVDALETPAPAPLELVACLRALVHGWDTDDDGVTFFEALHDARLVLKVLDAPEGTDTP